MSYQGFWNSEGKMEVANHVLETIKVGKQIPYIVMYYKVV